MEVCIFLIPTLSQQFYYLFSGSANPIEVLVDFGVLNHGLFYYLFSGLWISL